MQNTLFCLPLGKHTHSLKRKERLHCTASLVLLNNPLRSLFSLFALPGSDSSPGFRYDAQIGMRENYITTLIILFFT